MAEGIGYYDCVTEEFFGEADEDTRKGVLAFFKETLRQGDGCSLIKVTKPSPDGLYFEGYRRCRDFTTLTEKGS